MRFLGRTCIRGGSYENQRVWENQAAVLMRTNPINQWCFLKWQMAVLIRTAARFSGRTLFKKHPSGLPEDLFSYWESIFREDLFLYNCLQSPRWTGSSHRESTSSSQRRVSIATQFGSISDNINMTSNMMTIMYHNL